MDVLTLRKLMGHANFATTAGYLHVSAEQAVRVRSPLEDIAPATAQTVLVKDPR